MIHFFKAPPKYKTFRDHLTFVICDLSQWPFLYSNNRVNELIKRSRCRHAAVCQVRVRKRAASIPPPQQESKFKVWINCCCQHGVSSSQQHEGNLCPKKRKQHEGKLQSGNRYLSASSDFLKWMFNQWNRVCFFFSPPFSLLPFLPDDSVY